MVIDSSLPKDRKAEHGGKNPGNAGTARTSARLDIDHVLLQHIRIALEEAGWIDSGLLCC